MSIYRINKFWKRIILGFIIVPILILGSLVIYIQNNQSQIIKDELAKLNKEHQGLVSIGKSKLTLFGNFPYVSIKVYDVKVQETKAENAPVLLDVKDIYVGFNLWDIASCCIAAP